MLVGGFASESIQVNFTSHHFRHTLNALLDEGGLSDLLQTEWFGRKCSAECKDYVWVKDDKKRIVEQKRQYALAVLSRKAAQNQFSGSKPKKSTDWLTHNDKKIKTLEKQLADNGTTNFEPDRYLNEVNDAETL